MWDEITYPFSNFNGCTVDVWEWINNVIPHYEIDVITYPFLDYNSPLLVKKVPWNMQNNMTSTMYFEILLKFDLT